MFRAAQHAHAMCACCSRGLSLPAACWCIARGLGGQQWATSARTSARQTRSPFHQQVGAQLAMEHIVGARLELDANEVQVPGRRKGA